MYIVCVCNCLFISNFSISLTFDDQDNLLSELVKKYNGKKWKKIGEYESDFFPSYFWIFILQCRCCTKREI